MIAIGMSPAGGGGAAPAPSGGYVPPSDWLELPRISAGENKFAGVVAVWDVSTNYITVDVTVDSGTWSVDWGDGNSQTGISSGTVVEHNLTYDGATGDLTTRGYKTALVVVTTSGGNITGIDLTNRHSGASDSYISPWLNIRLAGSSISTFDIAGAQTTIGALEQLDFVGTNSITNLGTFFSQCIALVKVVNLDTSSATSMTNHTIGSYIRELPAYDLSGATSLSSVFTQFYGDEINISDLSTLTSASQLFRNSSTAKVINITNGSTGSLTSLSQFARNTYSLQYINGLGDTSAVTDWNFFAQNSGLVEVDAYDLSSATNLSQWLDGAHSVRRIKAYGATITHSIANCLLGVTEMEEYATNLGDGTGQTLTTSGNPASGSWDTTIATAKNWTVVD
jgi:hypothetical protein